MKRAALWLLLVPSCAPVRTDGLVCEADTECEDGRQCAAGICVEPEVDAGVPLDAAEPDAPIDAPACAAFRAQHFDACELPAPGIMTLDQPGTYTYDTAT